MRMVVFRGGGCYCFVGSFELRGVELSERERETSSLGGEEEEGRPLEQRTLRQSDSRPRGQQAVTDQQCQHRN